MTNTKLIIRPSEPRDVDDLYVLAQKAGQGLTSLPPCKATLSAKIEKSIRSFTRVESDPEDCFLLVMEDLDRGKVVGTAAVYGKTGIRQAFYSYRMIAVTHHSHSLNKQVRSELLHLSNDYTDCAEVGTLFLDPDYRGNGHWLSRSRYLLMGQFQHRFSPYVIAEMRGWLDSNGVSPFWESLGRHFFEMSFDEADRLCGIGSNQFITELMPKHPIYTSMLSAEAQAVMGRPHDDTVRAVELLKAEGFEYDKMIDIFDGGPLLRANIHKLVSVKNRFTRRATANSISGETTEQCMLANSSLEHFRVLLGDVTFNDEQAQLTQEQMAILQLEPNQDVHLLKKV